ncbi:MAG: bifunctional DNA primase/polymerase [Candidatus Hydrogenedentes bacterium]|nr:bifunctional DNA primase/polymerase [Candidatus Hydrogenedentota bacterium]
MRPARTAWQSEPRESLSRAMAWARSGNVGLRTGANSGVFVIDIDQVKGGVVPRDLPDTVTVQTGGGGLHLYFRMPEDVLLGNRKLAPHVDTRGDGGQVVFVGSVHPETSNVYAWAPGKSPDEIELAPLPRWVIDKLTAPVSSAPAPGDDRKEVTKRSPRATERCKAYLERIPDAVSGNGGHDATLRAACEAVRFDLGESELWEVMQWFNATKCQPPWTEKELRHKLTDAEAKAGHERGMRNRDNGDGHALNTTGSPEASETRNVVASTEPLRLAENFLEKKCRTNRLKRHAGAWYRYKDGAYELTPDEEIDATLYHHLDRVWFEKEDGKTGEISLVKLIATKRQVAEVVAALPAVIGVTVVGAIPQWLVKFLYQPQGEVIHCANGLLEAETLRLHPLTPDYFSVRGVAVAYDPNASTPAVWTPFLWDIFDGDIQSIALLQEWFGYCLTTDTRLQKMLFLIGPKRSGKGTIARVLSALVGPCAVAAPTLAGLATNFGCSSLIGKSLAIISDARLSGRTDQAIVIERLLSISGEDLQTIDRKHRDPVTMKLNSRFMLLSNELPALTDASGALASRFLLLSLTKSFYGKEDHVLTEKLVTELPGIFLWAIEGLQRLRENGRFIQPERSEHIVRELDDLSSPVGAFLRDVCAVAPGNRVRCSVLFDAWKAWCASHGRDNAGTVALFGRNLRAVVPGIRTTNSRSEDGRDRYYEGIAIQ